MTKAALGATTALVWTLGFGAAAALMYEVTRPVSLPPVAVAEGAPPAAEHAEAAKTAPPTVVVVPPAHVLVQRPQPAAIARVRSLDAVKRHCSDWKPLQQGYASVQVCE